MVPVLSLVFIVINMILGIALPVGLLIFFRKKYHATIAAFFIGCGVMFLFALVLEQIVHSVVLGSPIGVSIQSNALAMAIYGGLMAGLFEETGRYLAMRHLLKKHHDKWETSLMYGAGHGGFEAFVILTLSMVNNLIYSVIINSGMVDAQLAVLPEEVHETFLAAVEALTGTNSLLFMAAPLERLAAVAAQISLSIIVWFAATGKGRMHLYALAVLLHFLLDAVAAYTSALGVPIAIVEMIIWLCSIMTVISAVLVLKRYKART